MKLVTVEIEGTKEGGVLCGKEQKVVLFRELGLPFRKMNELIGKYSPEVKEKLLEGAMGEGGRPLSQVKLLAPIPRPAQDVICLGQNYMEHARESARYKKEAFSGSNDCPVYFSKRVNEAVENGGYVPSHKELTDKLDYEAELAVIIGKDARNVKEGEAGDYIFGYTILNDISARDIQTAHKQWYFGKSLDGSTPMGPWIVTADEIQYPPALQIQSYVNGELRQNSNTSQFLFDLDYVIQELSAGMTLKAGTILSTGTPAGVGMGLCPPAFLKPGDVVECRVEQIGSLINQIR